MKKPLFPILFATDSGYAAHLGTALYSLLQNNKSLNIRVVVFTTALSRGDRDKLQNICEIFSAPLEFVWLNDAWFDGLKLNYHFKKSNYYRLFAADLIRDDRCLYLDADIVVTGSILEIIATQLGDSYLAAIEDPGFDRHKQLGMMIDSKYFNSGVMLLNLSKWRSVNLKNQVISLVKRQPEVIYYVDQCGLNAVVDGEWVMLDVKYNYQTRMLTTPNAGCYTNSEIPCIIHYSGGDKPWHMDSKHPYKMIYWHYRNNTPYKSILQFDFNLMRFIRLVTPQLVKKLYRNIFPAKIIWK